MGTAQDVRTKSRWLLVLATARLALSTQSPIVKDQLLSIERQEAGAEVKVKETRQSLVTDELERQRQGPADGTCDLLAHERRPNGRTRYQC